MEESDHFETIAIRKQLKRTENREHSVPLYLTSSFVFDDAEQARALFADEIQGNIYTRFSNPNNSEFIDKICVKYLDFSNNISTSIYETLTKRIR